jgi:hypothetical protein
MATLNAFGHVTVRPVRVALVDAFADRESLRRGVRLASAHWGGMDYLLLPSPLDARALELARVLTDVAALVEPPSGGVELPEDLTYRSWPSENPFDRGDGSLRNHVLGMESLGEAPGGSGVAEPVDRVTWDPEHPLDGVLAVLHGALGEQGSYSPTERSRVNVGSAGPVPPTVQRTGLLARTRAGQFRRNAAAFRGVVCVDPESVGDLVGFWNLRAAGADVVLYPVGQQTLARDYLHAWFQDLADPTEELMLWATSAQIAERATADLAGWFPGRLGRVSIVERV